MIGFGEERPGKNGRFGGAAWLLFAGLALITLSVTVSCGGASGEQEAKEPAGKEQASVKPPQAEAYLEHPSLGQENAPVVLTEYADYQ